MKKLLVILAILLTLPFREGLGVGSLHASYFEVQVPMSERQQAFGTKQYGERQVVATGHFCTTVNAIDEYGHAYSPGQSANPSGPRRGKKVEENDFEDDPFMPSNVVPVGDVPWILLAFLIIVYIATIVPRTHSRRTFKLLLSHLSRVEQWKKILKK